MTAHNPPLGGHAKLAELLEDAIHRGAEQGTSFPLVHISDVEPPWPVGSTTNAKRTGWNLYFEGRSRDNCPFPPSRHDLTREYQAGWDFAQATEKAAGASAPPGGGVAGEHIPATDEVVRYISRFGGMCRDCADEFGVCPKNGLPCVGADKAIRHVLKVVNYGVANGYLPLASAPPPPALDLGERLRKRAQEVLDFVFKVEGAPGLVSIPRSADDVDALLCEAAARRDADKARIGELEAERDEALAACERRYNEACEESLDRIKWRERAQAAEADNLAKAARIKALVEALPALLRAAKSPGWAGAMVAAFAMRAAHAHHTAKEEAQEDFELAMQVATELPRLSALHRLVGGGGGPQAEGGAS